MPHSRRSKSRRSRRSKPQPYRSATRTYHYRSADGLLEKKSIEQLHELISDENIAEFQTQIIDQGFQNLLLPKNDSLLMMACEIGQPQIAQLLVDSGANLESTNDHGMTALMYASKNGHHNCVDVLIKAHANVDATASNGYTALIFALLHNEYEVAIRLIQGGASTHTALTIAAINGLYKCVDVLIEVGINVDATAENDENGYTALMYACSNNQSEVVQILIQGGANILKKGTDGHTALTIAASYGYNECVVAVLDTITEGLQQDLSNAIHAAQDQDIKKLLKQEWCIYDPKKAESSKPSSKPSSRVPKPSSRFARLFSNLSSRVSPPQPYSKID